MKRSHFLPLLFLVTTSIFMSGCTKEEDVTPDGTSRSAYIGKWSVSESWTKLSYEVTISEDPGSSNGVFISNFANTGLSATPASATVSGSSIVLDANQVISGLKISGSGALSGTKINWNYTIDDGANLIIAVATYTKQ
jgi:outer membrane lipoprotein-sorting protein